jgi:hypothetical protein
VAVRFETCPLNGNQPQFLTRSVAGNYTKICLENPTGMRTLQV